MPRLRAIFARLALVMALVAWAGGQLASTVHDLQTLHLRCLEHGHVIERDAHLPDTVGQDARDPGPQLKQAPDCGDHVDHCPLQLLPSLHHASDPVLAVRPAPLYTPAAPVQAATPARGPPLAYAPKTSPPTTC